MIAEKRRPQFTVRALLGAMCVVAVLCGGLVSIREALKPADEIGPVESYPEFPEPLRELLDDADQMEISVDPVEVYCVEYSWDETYFWQMKASPELMDLATEHWRLVPVDRNDGFVRLFWRRFPSTWSVPSKDNELEFFVHARQLDNTHLDTYVVMHDKTDQRLFVLYHFNF